MLDEGMAVNDEELAPRVGVDCYFASKGELRGCRGDQLGGAHVDDFTRRDG